MQIAILGAYLVGSTLGHSGTPPTTTSRSRHGTPPTAGTGGGTRARACGLRSPTPWRAEVVLVAIPGPAVTDVLQAVGPLDGRVMIDAANLVRAATGD